MNEKLKYMTKKGSFSAYRMTENGCLEILGRDHKLVENYFVFNGEHYYFGNQIIHFSSDQRVHNNLILAMTDTKLLIPQEDEDYLYIARNHMAERNQVIVVMYYYDNLLYYTIVSGSGSGRVHPVCIPYTNEAFNFCFHFAVAAIASVNPKIAEEFYETLKKESKEAKAALAGHKE